MDDSHSESRSNSRYETGMHIRRQVLGDEYVDRVSGSGGLNADFQRFVAEVAWGCVWARPGLPRGTRSLITIAILAALGRHDELALHLKATQNTGATAEEVTETLLHVAAYAGIPAANSAFALAKATLGATTPTSAPGRAEQRQEEP